MGGSKTAEVLVDNEEEHLKVLEEILVRRG